MRVHEQLYIGGEWVAPAGSDTITVLSPHTEQPVGRVPEATTADVDRAVATARAAFDEGEWPRMSPSDRIAAIRRFADAYAARIPEMAAVITEEMGSPITFSNLAQSPAPWMMLNSFLDVAESYPWEETRIGVLGSPVIVRRAPVGVVAAIVPWNVPQFVTMSKLAPALITGCTVVLKPSPETPLDAMLMGEILDEAQIPKGVVSILPAGREVGEHLVRHPGVDKVAFTGSTAAGRRIAAVCGDQLKRVTLELGGKSAAIVLEDADLSNVLQSLVPYSMPITGQVCFSLTRVLAPKSRKQEVLDAYVGAVQQVKVGDPQDPATQMGPLAMQRQLERVQGYIAKGKSEGAKIVTGGGRPKNLTRGYFIEPTVFDGVTGSMTIAREEIFGPVVSFIEFDSVDDAVRKANDTVYGLHGAVYTADPERGYEIARRMRSGSITVNGMIVDPKMPFGGFKQSGIGREGGVEGLDPYFELKTIYFA